MVIATVVVSVMEGKLGGHPPELCLDMAQSPFSGARPLLRAIDITKKVLLSSRQSDHRRVARISAV